MNLELSAVIPSFLWPGELFAGSKHKNVLSIFKAECLFLWHTGSLVGWFSFHALAEYSAILIGLNNKSLESDIRG